jgi:hypothetical protein
MSKARQMVGGRQARRPRADDQHALAALLRRNREGPLLLDGLVAEETLDGVNADGLVDLPTIAGCFAGVIADAANDGREGVVLGQAVLGLFVIAAFGME